MLNGEVMDTDGTFQSTRSHSIIHWIVGFASTKQSLIKCLVIKRLTILCNVLLFYRGKYNKDGTFQSTRSHSIMHWIVDFAATRQSLIKQLTKLYNVLIFYSRKYNKDGTFQSTRSHSIMHWIVGFAATS
jgi:VanZ family protein